jgi:hypothetical protein
MSDDMTDSGDSNGRDSRGRFAVGNSGGPGGSRRRAFMLRRAVEDAISPEDIDAMIRTAIRLGLEGNVAAIKFVLDRVCGRAAEAPKEAEPVPIPLPKLGTAADCNIAIERLIGGIVEGTVDREAAKLLIDAIQARLRALEATDLEQRLAELESAAGSVDPGHHRGRRF